MRKCSQPVPASRPFSRRAWPIAPRQGRWVVGVALLVLSGCSSPFALERWATREAELARTLRQIERSERGKPDQLRYALSRIRADIREDQRDFPRGVQRAGQYLREERRDWDALERAAPDKLRELFGGRPDEIESSAIRMFY